MSGQTGIYGLNEPALPPRPKSRLWKYIKILLVIIALFMISLFTLHKAGGNDASLKQVVEKYLRDSSGYKAEIGKLNAVSFYPLVGIDMDDVAFSTPDMTKVARIGHFNFSTSFWSVTSGDSIHTLDIRGVSIAPGIAAPGRVRIEQFFIDPKDKKVPQLSVTGFYGDKPLMMAVDLRVIKGMFGGVYFNFAEPAAFDLTAGDIRAGGQVITDARGRVFQLDKLFINGNNRPLQVSLSLKAAGEESGFAGKVQSQETAFDYDVEYTRKDGRRIINGSVKGDQVKLSDLTGAAGLFGDYSAFYDFWVAGQEAESGNMLKGTDLGLELDIAHVIDNGQDSGALKGRAVIKDGVFVIEPASKAGDVFAASMNAYFKK